MTIDEFKVQAEQLIRMPVPMETAQAAWRDADGDPQVAYALLEARMLAENGIGAPLP
jgi:hypothetical protein